MFIHDISRELVSFGSLSIRWYGLMFMIGVVLNFIVVYCIFRREKYPLEHLETVAIFLFLGMVIGARLGHVFFYEADFYLNNPIEILKIWEGGLASHGAAIGVFVAYLLWMLVYKVKFTKYADILVIGMPITAGFVRIGNFFNSEIVGRPTNGEWGVIFKRLGEGFPRHPSQLYEAGLSFAIFFVLLFVYLKYFKKLPSLFILFLYIFLYFLTRFIVEFWKERHVLPMDFPLSIGQILSILPIILAIGYFIFVAIIKPVRK